MQAGLICFLVIAYSCGFGHSSQVFEIVKACRDTSNMIIPRGAEQCSNDNDCWGIDELCCPTTKSAGYCLDPVIKKIYGENAPPPHLNQCEPECAADEMCVPETINCLRDLCPRTKYHCVKYEVIYDPCEPNPCLEDKEICIPLDKKECNGKLCMDFKCISLGIVVPPTDEWHMVCPKTTNLSFTPDSIRCNPENKNEDCPDNEVCCKSEKY